MTLVPLVWGPDNPGPDVASVSMTMAFVVMAFGTLLTGLAVGRDPETGLGAPILEALGVLSVPALLTIVATTWTLLQSLLTTQPLSGEEWLRSLVLASIVLLVVETEKLIRRRLTARSPEPLDPISVVYGSRPLAVERIDAS